MRRKLHIPNHTIEYNVGKTHVNFIVDGKRYNYTKDYIRGEEPKIDSHRVWDAIRGCSCLEFNGFNCYWDLLGTEERYLAKRYLSWKELTPEKLNSFVKYNILN